MTQEKLNRPQIQARDNQRQAASCRRSCQCRSISARCWRLTPRAPWSASAPRGEERAVGGGALFASDGCVSEGRSDAVGKLHESISRRCQKLAARSVRQWLRRLADDVRERRDVGPIRGRRQPPGTPRTASRLGIVTAVEHLRAQPCRLMRSSSRGRENVESRHAC